MIHDFLMSNSNQNISNFKNLTKTENVKSSLSVIIIPIL